jgi:NitT/TauT family transport system permease protein
MQSEAVASGCAPWAPRFVAGPVDFVRSHVWLLVRVAVFYAALLGIWQLLYNLEIWSPYLFPSPREVWDELWKNIDNGMLQDAVRTTMKRLAIGFALAFVAGMIIGVACGTMRWVDETLGSLVLGMQSLPSISWVPAAILWFGISERTIIFIVLMGSVWAIAISARDGVRTIPPLQRRAAQVFGASRWQMIRHVTLPGMLPSMSQGLKLGWSFSWRSLMAGEIIFVTGGLGFMLQLGRDLNRIELVFAVMAVIVAVGFAVDRLVFGPLERWVHSRWGLAG